LEKAVEHVLVVGLANNVAEGFLGDKDLAESEFNGTFVEEEALGLAEGSLRSLKTLGVAGVYDDSVLGGRGGKFFHHFFQSRKALRKTFVRKKREPKMDAIREEIGNLLAVLKVGLVFKHKTV
jgi:hypothetical protein|tara:strand:- start:21 stop:389 length:369 start_codon:yes stop_codon:yes gene_type:complete